ncbi:MAG: Alw26I/Eco31I/Esp3I family type II restriction adenine-specific DNA-methyltransferase, partial [Bacteroidota bacterium]
MEHIETLKASSHTISRKLLHNTTGKFYTHFDIGMHLTKALVSAISERKAIGPEIKIVDPFAGDGRLIEWLINTWLDFNLPTIHWHIEFWDINAEGLKIANDKMQKLIQRGVSMNYTINASDAFKLSQANLTKFDVVITNPPWELLKPDTRELQELEIDLKKEYVESIRKYDFYLTSHFPKAQPKKKFAGWGTNLSRVGLELSHLICKENGFVAIVIPASFFADDQSLTLRSEIVKCNELIDIAFFPAEAKLFAKADVNSATFIYRKSLLASSPLCISIYNKEVKLASSSYFNVEANFFTGKGNTIPISLNTGAIQVLNKITSNMPTWEDLERIGDDSLWAGRELDETGRLSWLSDKGNGPKFIKGGMIERYALTQQPSQFINKENWNPPVSCNFERIGWRDVSRSTQKRRLIATLIPQNTVAGNSLNIAYFKDGNLSALKILLSVMNSLCFEFQLRSHLATGHVSLSSIRKVCVPSRKKLLSYCKLEAGITQVMR